MEDSYIMASDAVVFVRMESYVKKGAEMILRELGVTPTELVTMLYHQIILKEKIPFEISLPNREPIATGDMSNEEVMKIVQTGVDDVKAGRTFTLEEAKALFDLKYKKKIK